MICSYKDLNKSVNMRAVFGRTQHYVRFMSSSRWLSKKHQYIIGINRALAYLAVDNSVEAVNLAPELDINMPQTPEHGMPFMRNTR